VLEVAEVDLNVMAKIQKREEQADRVPGKPVYVKRILVVTNCGLVVMKDIEASLRCPDCEPSKFCPRGPTIDFAIRYDQIDTIVSFPLIPQKVAIKFRAAIPKAEDPSVVNLAELVMTINVKTLTKAAKLSSVIADLFLTIREEAERR
jgi:hypothetical protein